MLLITDFVQNDTQAMSRVLQGLITGLGFLGAGVILHEQRSSKIHGLTTAASLWTCALVGAAFGAGQFILGLMSIGAIFFALALGGPMEKLISRLTGIKRGSEISDDSE